MTPNELLDHPALVALMPAAVVFLAFHHAIKHTDKYWRCKDDANAIVAKTCKADLRFRGSATPPENPH